MARASTIRTQLRWAGAIADFARTSRTAARLLREQTGVDPAHSFAVEMPGLEMDYDSPEELEREVAVADLSRIDALTVRVTDQSADEYEIVVRLSSLGVRLTASGPNRTVVEGLTARLEEVLRERQLPPWANGEAMAQAWAVLLPLALLVWLMTGDLYDRLPRSLQDAGWWLGAALVGFMVIVLAIAAWIAYLSPPFELVAAGAPTRFERLRHRWKWFAGVLVVAVVSALVARFLA